MNNAASQDAEAPEAPVTVGGPASRLPFGMTGAEPVFERVAALASALFGKVYVSIVVHSDGSVWRNIDPDGRLILGTPVADRVTAAGTSIWWENLADDPHLASAPLVANPPFVKFAAGAPIQLHDGAVQGALSVVGLAPRPLDPQLLANLERLAAMIADECDRARTALALKTQEAALVAAKEEAEAANQAKSTFLATMSHEIRTPLNGVLGMAQVMAVDPLSEAQRGRLRVIRESGESLLAILNDVLDLSKIEAGKLDLEEIEFDLEELARSAHAAFQGVAAGKGLDFGLAIDPNACGLYRGDSTRLRQVISNLVSNALKFTERGRVDLSLARDGVDLVVTVSDTGVGVPPDRLARLFDKFEQADASTTRRFGGTGLGLSICRELVQLMGGEIAAASTPGAGASFTVRLPLPYLGRQDPAIWSDAPGIEPEALPTLRILAAEDNAVNRLVLITILQQAGLDPVAVVDGAEAVDLWRREAWDLILMDVQMPGMDGPTAARRIRSEEAASGRARTPIIALTANAMAHQVAEYLQAGMDDFVAKPLEMALLFAAIERVLGAAEPAERACG